MPSLCDRHLAPSWANGRSGRVKMNVEGCLLSEILLKQKFILTSTVNRAYLV